MPGSVGMTKSISNQYPYYCRVMTDAEQPLRAAVVRAARGWIGTCYHHQGRVKATASHAGGVDCLGLLVGVAAELGLKGPDGTLLASFDRADYPLEPSGEALCNMLKSLLTEGDISHIRPGDIAVMEIGGIPRHLGIVTDMPEGLGLIHAFAPVGKVVETLLAPCWRRRIKYLFFM